MRSGPAEVTQEPPHAARILDLTPLVDRFDVSLASLPAIPTYILTQPLKPRLQQLSTRLLSPKTEAARNANVEKGFQRNEMLKNCRICIWVPSPHVLG